MIVADANLIVYFYVSSIQTPLAEAARSKDAAWMVPRLWRSEVRNALTLHIRKGLMDLDRACEIMADAEILLAGCEHEVDSATVLRLSRDGGGSAYDCEYLALAERLGTKVVTADRKLVAGYPALATMLADFVA